MKIVIDGRFWGPGHTGLGVYTQNIVENLTKSDKKNQYVILRPNISVYTVKEQVVMPYLLYKEKPNLVHFPSINVPILYFGKYIITVHDLIKHDFRGVESTTNHPILYWPKFFLYLFIVWWAVHFAKKIIVPSNDVKKRLLKQYKLDENKIIVTYEAAVLKPATKEKFPNLPERFAVYTGNAYPHKNLERLIKIWPKIFAKTKTKLLIFCGRSIFTKRIEKLIGQNGNIKFMGYIPNGQLAYIYPFATVYICPSLAEGFGIPGLDAMNFSLPVVCSDIAVLHEIYGLAAHYFNPLDENDMAKKIIEVLADQKLRRNLINFGKIRVKKYSWTKTAAQTLKAYESCFSL